MELSAACHVHSEWSYDGSWSLEALAATFSGRGQRIVLMTEHDRGFTPTRFDEFRRACAAASSDAVFVMPGIEYSDSHNRVHVLVWGAPFLGDGLPTFEMLEAVRAANGVAVLAHPSRKQAWASFEPRWTERLLGIELWNRKYDGWAPSDTAPGLLGETGLVSFVGLDFHTPRQLFPLEMVLDVRGQLSEDSILASLRARACHARAFGMPLTSKVLTSAEPVLNLMEQGRRTAASIARASGLKR